MRERAPYLLPLPSFLSLAADKAAAEPALVFGKSDDLFPLPALCLSVPLR